MDIVSMRDKERAMREKMPVDCVLCSEEFEDVCAKCPVAQAEFARWIDQVHEVNKMIAETPLEDFEF